MRASDADRDAVVDVLREATVHGMLTLDECDERMAAAYGARFQHDLPPLTADLPPVPAAAPAAPGWRALSGLALLQARTSLAVMPGSAVLRSRPGLAAVLALLATLPLLGVLEVGELLGVELLDD
ncbi:DUF1707 domain-containing protein [Geodermatophilus sp. DF01-2]|nr:DUF1707 domain-containing protein [Geodermatophilus sp. DF01_2]